MLNRPISSLLIMFVVLGALAAPPAYAAAGDIVLTAADAKNLNGHWSLVSDSSAAGGRAVSSSDSGWATTDTALASPGNYFEFTFDAAAGTSYHVWLRLAAGGNSKFNDSVYAQFSDSTDTNGSPLYRIGTTSALDVNLQSCNGCALSGWGWIDGAYWLSQPATIRFSSSGSHTLRIQTREDGVSLDQVVLSPSSYLTGAPGPVLNDSTILSAGAAATTTAAAVTASGSLTPYSGAPVSIPGTVTAENFDNGGEGVAYHDNSPGNSGGQYRSSDVDIEASSDGGYDVGWTSAGEWLNYTVYVSSGGGYTAQVRVASPNGGTMHLGFNTASNVWTTISVPPTGGWQSWTTINVPVNLGAGLQQMTVLFDNGGVNLRYVNVVAGATSSTPAAPAAPPPPPPPPPPPSGSGTTLSAITWNIQINDGSENHARVAMDMALSAGPRPDVIVIVEAYQNLFNVYVDELQRQTGQTWYGAFATHCEAGQWGGNGCNASWYQGVGIFSTYRITDTSSRLFPYADCWTSARVGLRAALNVNGTAMQVFATHLQTGGCANDAQSRYNSMRDLKGWASNYGGPQIAAGDFNADPDQIDTTSGMSPNFVDTWSLVGSGRGFSAFAPNPSMKIDYWFTDAGGRAQPTSSQVLYSTGSVSDHFPVQTTFSIR